MKTITTWLIAISFITAWMMACAHFDAERFSTAGQASQEHHLSIIASQACGENSAPTWLDDSTIECRNKYGNRPVKVQVKK
jgi:hypothetical protein